MVARNLKHIFTLVIVGAVNTASAVDLARGPVVSWVGSPANGEASPQVQSPLSYMDRAVVSLAPKPGNLASIQLASSRMAPVVRVAMSPFGSSDSTWGAAPVYSPYGCDMSSCDAAGCDSPGCDDSGCSDSGCGIGQGGLASGFGLCRGCNQRLCCCPHWYVDKSTMFLRRQNNSSTALVTDQGTGNQMLGTSDYDDDYAIIPRLQIIRKGANCHGWELDLFGLSPFSTDAVSGGAVSPLVILPGFPVPSSAPGTLIGSDYETRFSSFAFNYRHYVNDCLTLVAGFRWLELGDTLNVTQVAPIQQDLYNINTNNHLYGFQLGLNGKLWQADRFSINTFTRAGIFGNNSDMDIEAPLVNGLPGFVDNLHAQGDRTSFFGELGLVGSYQLNNRLSLQGGYQLMWLDGVALAPDQLAGNSLIAPGTAVLDDAGSLFFSGAILGASWCY